MEIGPGDLWFRGDRGHLLQVMSNLVGNASKYSPEGSRIEVTVRPEGDRLAMEVRDEGVGISEEDQHRLFIPFSRIENEKTGTVAGSGLGLVIAKAIVELHGGRIWMDSEVGVGTTVHFQVRELLRDERLGVREGREQSEETGS